MSFLEINFSRIEIDITKGASRTEEFLKINPNGRVPVLETPDKKYLPESNAALWYLASDSDLMPEDKFEQVQVLQWMFFEQYSHEPFIATSRYWVHILNKKDQYKSELLEKRPKGYAALDVVEQHLEDNNFFVGNKFSAADIALYAYTHVANEGGFDLSKYTAINKWFSRIENVRNYITINE